VPPGSRFCVNGRHACQAGPKAVRKIRRSTYLEPLESGNFVGGHELVLSILARDHEGVRFLGSCWRSKGEEAAVRTSACYDEETAEGHGRTRDRLAVDVHAQYAGKVNRGSRALVSWSAVRWLFVEVFELAMFENTPPFLRLKEATLGLLG